VNVHPAKTEVRFVRPSIVQDTLRDAVRAAIGAAKAAVTPFIEKQQETSRVETTTRPPGAASLDQLSTTAQPLPISREELKGAFRIQAPKPPPAPEQRKMNLSFAPQPQQKGEAASPPIEEPLSDYAIGAEDSVLPVPVIEGAVREEKPEEPVVIYYGSRLGCLGARGGDLSNSNLKPAQNLSLNADEINPLGQLHNSFILAADRNGLLVIDQHVAHERILFERHWRALTRNRVEVQRLLLPETLDLTPAQAATIDQMLPELEENGFEIGRLSGRTIAIKAVPALLPAGTARELLAELLDAIEQERRGLTMDELRAEIAASLACRAAIKINMTLAPEKMHWLIDELLVTDNPATCPHVRPSILRVSTREIEKGFQRS